MFREEAERYCSDHIIGNTTSVEEALQRMQDHFFTLAPCDSYITKWNSLTFVDLERQILGKTETQYLDLLCQHDRELQSMLDPVYESSLLLRDCIINAVKSKQLYIPLLTAPYHKALIRSTVFSVDASANKKQSLWIHPKVSRVLRDNLISPIHSITLTT